jgi:hypothetical protein
MPAGGLVAKIVVEREDAVDFGARQIERRRDHRDRRLGHVAECLLQRVQDHQRSAFDMAEAGDDLGAALGIPWFINWRHPRSLSVGY